MKRLNFYSLCLGLIAIPTLTIFTSCVNEEYDLDKEIDMEMTLLKNVSLPVGNIEKFTLAEILEIETSENSTGIIIDENGDYMLNFSGEKIESQIEIPSMNMADGGTIESEPIEVVFPTVDFDIIDGVIVEKEIVYSEATGSPLETELMLDFNTTFPKEVVDIKEVTVDSRMIVNIGTSEGRIYIKPGFTIEFPDNIYLSLSDNTVGYKIENAHKVVFTEAVSTDVSLNLHLDKITIPAGMVKDSSLKMNEEVSVSGDFYLNTLDFSDIPSDLRVFVNASISDLNVKSATVKLGLSTEIPGVEVQISDMPEFLAGDKVNLDLYNPMIGFRVVNNSPLLLNFSADMTAYNGKTDPVMSLGEDPEISIDGLSTSEYLISRRAVQTSAQVKNLVMPEIADFISIIPEKLSVDNIQIDTPEDFITVESGKSYSAEFEYWLDTPLSFGNALNFEYTIDINDLGLDFDGNVKSAALAFEMVNSIPLNLTLDAVAIDSEGNVINGMTLGLDKQIVSGTHKEPVTTPVSLQLNNSNDRFTLDGLRLTVKAAGPAESQVGTALNSNQGLEIRNLSLSVPDGITLNAQ
ncbi:MAG: hypothetical protein IJ954_04680 [Bacteroidales bacterium]|nr:hypothetical protein [Bacteroidales bacterium]